MPPRPKGIGRDSNLFTASYDLLQFVMKFFYKIVDYIGYVIFIISDYVMEFACYLMSVSMIDNTPFPLKYLTYAILAVRIICLVYGFKLIFAIMFKDFMSNIFTRSNTSQCSGNIDSATSGILGKDGDPLCKTAIYVGSNYITGQPTTVQYDYDQMNTASLIAIKQMAYWIICLNLFAIPATLKGSVHT
jgi:hypothetical protein